MCQTMAQMTMIVTQHLHHVGTYRQFWTEQQMVLTSMLHHMTLSFGNEAIKTMFYYDQE